jgi:hypothetical protein
LRGDTDAMTINWLMIEIRNAAGEVTYHNSFITDLPVGHRVLKVSFSIFQRARPQAANSMTLSCPQSFLRTDAIHHRFSGVPILDGPPYDLGFREPATTAALKRCSLSSPALPADFDRRPSPDRFGAQSQR